MTKRIDFLLLLLCVMVRLCSTKMKINRKKNQERTLNGDQLFIQPNHVVHSIHDVYVNYSFTSVNESSEKKMWKKKLFTVVSYEKKSVVLPLMMVEI